MTAYEEEDLHEAGISGALRRYVRSGEDYRGQRGNRYLGLYQGSDSGKVGNAQPQSISARNYPRLGGLQRE
ncbi:MAG TPA: hypothetical protein PKG96_08780 [Bacilli bacterium]|mgnify:CR=1 FL=1|nr:hypothetical protein [Bacilli bacterium]